MVKTTGFEFKKFYDDKIMWPEGSYHEDEIITIDGKESDYETDLSKVNDSSKITISGGIVFLNEDDTDGPSLESYFKLWKRKQVNTTILIDAPNEKLDEIIASIVSFGGKIIKN